MVVPPSPGQEPLRIADFASLDRPMSLSSGLKKVAPPAPAAGLAPGVTTDQVD